MRDKLFAQWSGFAVDTEIHTFTVGVHATLCYTQPRPPWILCGAGCATNVSRWVPVPQGGVLSATRALCVGNLRSQWQCTIIILAFVMAVGPWLGAARVW